MTRPLQLSMLQLVALVLSLSAGVFIVGFLVVTHLPMPVTLGGLRTDWISVSSGAGSGRITITTKPDGGPKIVLYDASGNSILSLDAAAKGAPGTQITSANGDQLITISTLNKPAIRVFDPNTGTVVWEAVK